MFDVIHTFQAWSARRPHGGALRGRTPDRDRRGPAGQARPPEKPGPAHPDLPKLQKTRYTHDLLKC